MMHHHLAQIEFMTLHHDFWMNLWCNIFPINTLEFDGTRDKCTQNMLSQIVYTVKATCRYFFLDLPFFQHKRKVQAYRFLPPHIYLEKEHIRHCVFIALIPTNGKCDSTSYRYIIWYPFTYMQKNFRYYHMHCAVKLYLLTPYPNNVLFLFIYIECS